jgi:hypothetical protein
VVALLRFALQRLLSALGLLPLAILKKNAADCIFLVTFLVSYRCKFAFSSFGAEVQAWELELAACMFGF